MQTSTLLAFTDLYPEAVVMWLVFVALPVLTCGLWTWLNKSKLHQAWHAFSRSVALTLGYPALLIGTIIVPIAAFQIFFAPALLESLPAWRSVLLAVLQVPNWFVAQAFWLIPVSWLLWAIVAPKFFINQQLAGGAK